MPTRSYSKGALTRVQVNRYERNEEARRRCIELYGAVCCICGFDFGRAYGEVGRGLIHVHHIVPLGEIRAAYQVDPIRDLRPVCANCHAVIHRRDPAYTVEEVAGLLAVAKAGTVG